LYSKRPRFHSQRLCFIRFRLKPAPNLNPCFQMFHLRLISRRIFSICLLVQMPEPALQIEVLRNIRKWWLVIDGVANPVFHSYSGNTPVSTAKRAILTELRSSDLYPVGQDTHKWMNLVPRTVFCHLHFAEEISG